MLTINIYLRFALIIIFLGSGVVLSLLYGIKYAWPLLLVGVILLAGYFLMGTILSAGKKIQVMDFEGAEKMLKLTYFPGLLFKPNRAYYYLISGTLDSQLKRSEQAFEKLHKAQEIGLPTDNDKATVALQLAGLYANKGKWQQAKKVFKEVENYTVTEPQIKEQIQEFSKALKQSGNLRSVGNRRMMTQPGGKRRRPKMR